MLLPAFGDHGQLRELRAEEVVFHTVLVAFRQRIPHVPHNEMAIISHPLRLVLAYSLPECLRCFIE